MAPLPQDATVALSSAPLLLPGFSAPFVRVVVDYVRAQDVAIEPVLQALAVEETELADASRRVPGARLAQALVLASRLCGDAHVGLHIAALVRPAHLGALGYALMSCTEGGDGLALYERVQSLLCNEIRVHHEIAGGVLATRHEALGPLPRDYAFWSFLVAARIGFARWVSGKPLVPLRIDMPCRQPVDLAPFLQFAGGPVRFDTPDCRELIPVDWLSWLNPNADPGVHSLMASMVGQQWQAASQDADEVIALLRQRIVLSLYEGVAPTLDGMAGSLGEAGPSTRQLQRRLAEQGLAFKDLVEEVRREQAIGHLQHTDLPMAMVAQRVGYAELSSFHRAVRRWTGQTPAAVRAQAPALIPDEHSKTK